MSDGYIAVGWGDEGDRTMCPSSPNRLACACSVEGIQEQHEVAFKEQALFKFLLVTYTVLYCLTDENKSHGQF